ncbi:MULTISPECIES: hypothetical protein [unclassified Polaribacter]|uniref:hypothetical protein n=1 Tax=unclassified Polaribacter TaxID=196858 RepID=UPI0011BF051C|nr:MULTISPECIES: hypothetical protein [unclassified Polaribacter]TXD54296.1 hypothetical protein ES043_00130 [Polaribacter sp. IC063]TXD62873.1 hypothetical protein ES044_00630 [Polaribacter sp. IC066]
MKNLKLYSLLFIALAAFSSCEDKVEPLGTSYASFESYLGDITVTPGVDYAQSVSIFTANITGADRTIPLMLSGTLGEASYTAPTSVTIPANTNQGVIDLVFKDVNLDIVVDKTLSIALTGSSDISVGEKITLNVAKGCAAGEGKFKIAVSLDAYPEEVYWRVVDVAANAIVLQNNTTVGFGGYAGASGTQRDATCLPAGEYRFEIFDQYEDGAGAVNFSINGVQVFSSNGAYGAGTSTVFTVN